MPDSQRGHAGTVAMTLALLLVAAGLAAPLIMMHSDSSQRHPAAGDALWNCHNEVEVQCLDSGCTAAAADAFTPMQVSLSGSGTLSVCAYSGCWEGVARVTRVGPSLLWTGEDVPWLSAVDNPDMAEDVLIVFDPIDDIALIRVGPFAQPLRCDQI